MRCGLAGTELHVNVIYFLKVQTVQSSESDRIPKSNLETAIHERLKRIKSGKYHADTKHIFTEFAQWLQENKILPHSINSHPLIAVDTS